MWHQHLQAWKAIGALFLQERGLRIVAFSFAVAMILIDVTYGAYQLAYARGGIQPNTIPIGSDFIALWSVGHLTHLGTPALAYDNTAVLEMHRLAIPDIQMLTYWFYPPTAQLMAWPFGTLPYLVALPLYLLLTLGLYTFVMWRLRPQWETLLFVAAFQGTWLCLYSGQNGLLSAALMGGAFLLYPRHPCWAGAVWSVFAYKPQLAVQVPFALLTQGRKGTKAIAMAAVTGTLFVTLSAVLLGQETWHAFFATLTRPLGLLEREILPLDHMVSVYSALRLTGWTHTAALVFQGGVALLMLGAVRTLWRSPASLHLKGAGLIWGALLTTPHLFQYELPLMGLGLLLLWIEGDRTGWRKGEQPLLLLAWLSPPFVPFTAFPLLFLMLMLHALRRQRFFQPVEGLKGLTRGEGIGVDRT